MLIPLYFAISMLSAFLLFLVQPMAAKAVLPVLGGAPFVWNGCMLFFQAVLLGGYLYSHKAISHLPVRLQVVVHLSLLVFALIVFPGSFTGRNWVDAANSPLLWLMTTLLTSIAIPFFALSATAPLIQSWFSVSGHARASNPYFLYSASNLGSFGSLLCYLVAVEPYFTRSQQLTLMQVGFGLFVLLFVMAGLRLRQSKAAADSHAKKIAEAEPVTRDQIRYWLLLSFVPSSLLYGVTLYINTDVASIPLLWVVPLALYLLTFVLVFADKPKGVALCRMLHTPAATAMVMIYLWGVDYNMWLMLVHMIVFFIVTMSCHGALSDLRPGPSQLTNFYLWVSLGGVLGGAFNTFIAPNVFGDITEYPLMLALSVLACVPMSQWRERPIALRNYLPGLAALVFGLVFWVMFARIEPISLSLHQTVVDVRIGLWFMVRETWKMSLVAILCFSAYRYRLMTAGVSAGLLLSGSLLVWTFDSRTYQFTERNIFGVNRVYYQSWNNANYFRHGTTDHGRQMLDEKYRLAQTSYYGPVKMFYHAVEQLPSLAKLPTALMGLGVGTVTCNAKADTRIDIFEIDPLVLEIATNDKFFTYMRDCPPEKNVEIGDGRISLANKPDHTYSLIVVDVFTSDAVPVHVMTMEAIDTYLNKLADGGMVALHVTNRHLMLKPVISAIAHKLNAHAYHFMNEPDDNNQLEAFSEWIVITRDPSVFDRLKKQNDEWYELRDTNPEYLWTDDFSNILKVVKIKTDFWGLF